MLAGRGVLRQGPQDDSDIARCEQTKASGATGLSHDAFMALLAAEAAGTA